MNEYDRGKPRGLSAPGHFPGGEEHALGQAHSAVRCVNMKYFHRSSFHSCGFFLAPAQWPDSLIFPPLRTYFFLSYFFSEIHTTSPPFPFDFLFSLETTSPVVISLNTEGRRGGLSMGNSRNKARSLLLRLKKRNPDLWKLIKLLFAFLKEFFLVYFVFGCAASLLLCRLFSGCGKWGLLSSCCIRAPHCSGIPCCRARSLRCTGCSSCCM